MKNILKYPANGGKPSSIPVSNLTLDGAGRGVQLAVDSGGYMVVGYTATKIPRLVKYGPTGGKPQVLALGTFTNVVVG